VLIVLLMTAVMFGVLLDWSDSAPEDQSEDTTDFPEEMPEVQPEQLQDPQPVEVQDTDEGVGRSDPSETDEPPETRVFSFGSGETVLGSAGDDIFLLDPDFEEKRLFVYSSAASGSVVTGGDGDDRMFLHDNNTRFSFGGGSVDGGAGDDQILISGVGIAIDGGTGNDTIETSTGSRLWDATVQGGDGDDIIDVTWQNGDGFASLNGGAGDDLIDIRESVNTNTIAFGDEGNDTIRIGPDLHSRGTGYTTAGNGGDGDDQLIQDADVRALLGDDRGRNSPMLMTGGEGADIFELNTVSGSGLFGSFEGAPDVVSREWMIVTDFEVGTDAIVFDLEALTSGFLTPSTAQMIEDTEAGETLVSVVLDAEGFSDQALVIRVAAVGLDWDDMQFVGASPALEEPSTLVA